jgi:hypothetical protein
MDANGKGAFKHPGFRTVWLLALFNAIAMSATPMMLAGSLVAVMSAVRGRPGCAT